MIASSFCATVCDVQELTRAVTDVNVRRAREAAGLSQERLAARAGLSTRTVARIEGGEDTTIGTLAAIARALGVAVVDLITEVAA